MSAGFDLAAVRAGLVTIFQDISGISDVVSVVANRAVTEQDRPWVMPDPATDARLEFKLISLVSLGGGDEVRQEYDPDLVIEGDTSGPNGDPATGGFVVGVGGPRVMTFSVKVVCHDLVMTAFEYVERVRSNLNRPSILDRIAELECSLNDIGGSRDMSYAREGRMISVAGFDLVLNITSNLEDDPITTIETVNTTNETHA